MHRLTTFTSAAREQAGYLLLLAVMISGSVFLLLADHAVKVNVAAAKEEARPAEVELTLLTVADCDDCFDISSVADALASGPMKLVKRKEVSYESGEGEALVEKYGISTVPTAIIRGEIEKANAAEFLKNLADTRGDAAVWSFIPPVFVDTATGREVGRVKTTIIKDSTCKDCYDALRLEEVIRRNYGVNISETLTLDRYSPDGRKLIASYGINALPVLILSADTSAYRKLVQVWPQVGTIEDDGSFVFRALKTLGSVYRDLETGKIIQPVTAN